MPVREILESLLFYRTMFAVIIYGLESYSLEGLFYQKEEAIKCAKEQQTNGNIDNVFYFGVNVYEGEGTNLNIVYNWTIDLS